MTNDPIVHNNLLDSVREYHVPEYAQELLSSYPPLIIAGITASGKNSITKYITENGGYRQVVTHTTRTPREGEVNSQHYHFVTEAQMLDLINSQAMIEVQNIHDSAVYGISIDAYKSALEGGQKPLLVIDVQGVDVIYKYLPSEIRPFFLLPPSFEQWMTWLEKRGRMSHTDKLRRMKSAQVELKKALKSDEFLLVVNNEDEVSRTAELILHGSHDPSLQYRNRQTAALLTENLEKT